MISELLLIVSAFFAPAAVSVAAEAHAPTSIVVFIDFSASIQGADRSAYRRESRNFSGSSGTSGSVRAS